MRHYTKEAGLRSVSQKIKLTRFAS